MSIPDRVSPDLELPEQHLLRDGDRIQEYACAYLNGELTAQQYSALTLAEISRRAPVDLPMVDLPPDEPVQLADVLPVGRDLTPEDPAPEDPTPHVPVALPPDPVQIARRPAQAARPQRTDADRSLVLAEAFVSGRVRGTDFLRLIRDC